MVASLFCQTLHLTLKHQWHAALHASGHMLEMNTSRYKQYRCLSAK